MRGQVAGGRWQWVAVALVAGALIGLVFSGIDLILLGIAARLARSA